MKRALATLLLASLMACSTPSIRPELLLEPVALSPEAKAPCPALPFLKDRTIETLTLSDHDAVLAYAECQAKHGRVVAAYTAFYLAYLQLKAPKK